MGRIDALFATISLSTRLPFAGELRYRPRSQVEWTRGSDLPSLLVIIGNELMNNGEPVNPWAGLRRGR